MFSVEFIQNVFLSSNDEIFIIKENGDIVFKNDSAKSVYPDVVNLSDLSPYFDFQVCILNSEDLINFSPISALINSKENFYASVIKQVNPQNFIEYSINTFNIENGQKIVILKNDFAKVMHENYEVLEQRNIDLEKQISYIKDLKITIENNLLRSNLINLLSDKVREYIESDKIVKIILEQLKKTLDIKSVNFEYNSKLKVKKTKSVVDADNSTIKLIAPVFNDEDYFGNLILYKKIPNSWQNEEITLIQNVCSLLTTSFSKEKLYKELTLQKRELENALKQLKDAQLQIVQSEKMASLGQLVAGVAHEINTPLGAISSNWDMLSKISETNLSINELQDLIKEITPVNKEALHRIEHLVKSLKNFARLDEAKLKKVDITEGLKSTIDLISHETKNKVEIVTNFAKLPQIACFPDYINQVFMNILLNACQSIQSKGVVNISTYSENSFICVKITDNGSGIKDENLEKIFDFGFTTKKIGQGTGLGLALVKKIVDEHKGKIEVESELNKGTTFVVKLPIN